MDPACGGSAFWARTERRRGRATGGPAAPGRAGRRPCPAGCSPGGRAAAAPGAPPSPAPGRGAGPRGATLRSWCRAAARSLLRRARTRCGARETINVLLEQLAILILSISEGKRFFLGAHFFRGPPRRGPRSRLPSRHMSVLLIAWRSPTPLPAAPASASFISCSNGCSRGARPLSARCRRRWASARSSPRAATSERSPTRGGWSGSTAWPAACGCPARPPASRR